MTPQGINKYETDIGSDLLFERLFESSPDGILVADGSGRIVRANAPAEKMFGYNRGDLQGQPIEVLVPERFRDAHAFYRRDYIAKLRMRPGNISVESYARRSDGSEFPAEIIVTPVVESADGPLVLAVVRDITTRQHSEEVLRNSENTYRTLLENLPQKIFLKNKDSVYVSCNQNLARDLKIQPEEIQGKTDLDFFPRALAEKYRADDRKIIESGGTEEIEEEYLQDGQKRLVHTVKTAIKDDNGNTVGVLGIFWDITERKRAEEALRDREQLLQSILDNSPATIYLKDLEGRYLKVNRHCAEALGASEEQILGKSLHDFFPQELADAIQACERKVIETRSAMQFEDLIPRQDGLHTSLSIKFPLFDSSGTPYAVCGISTDITERKRAEEALREREQLLESILHNSPAVIYIKDLEGRYRKVNRHCAEGLGASPEQIIGKSVHDFFPKELADPIQAHEQKVLETRSAMQFEDVVPRQDGLHTTLAVKFPLFDSSGNPYAVCGISTDITERKRAEEALRQSETRFRQIAENIQEVFWIVEIESGELLYASPAYEGIWGRSLDSIYQHPSDWIEGIHPGDREGIQNRYAEALQKKERFEAEYRVVRPDGSIRFIHDRGFPVLDATGRPYRLAGVATDITERKQAQDALREREQLLESILDNTTAVVYLKDRDGRLLKVNRQYERIFGLRKDEVIGKTDYDLFPKEMADRWRIHDEKVLETGSPMEFEEVVPQTDGLHTYLSIKFPVYLSSGIPYAVGGISTDITERKKTEAALLLEVTNVLISNLEPQKLFTAISASIRQVVAHDFASLALYDSDTSKLRLLPLTWPSGVVPTASETLLPISQSPAGWVFTIQEPVVLNRIESGLFPPGMPRGDLFIRWIAQGVRSVCWLPLLHSGSALGVLVVASLQEEAFPDEKVRLLTQVANQVAVALDNALAFRQIADNMDRLAQEKRYLQDELKTEYNFEEIVGESAALKRVLNQVETVAHTDATVLILGETGTGKELIARALHNLSPRHERTFVKLNCAAVPSGLLESELFGHERGAFTGAIARKIGRLEVANGGTLLLDEIGDIPLELQPKLLRALQEKEFERLGSTRTIPADVRVVAATNRDLAQMVKDGRFRRDLFYRLSVFPITIPPLRERPEDIPLLVHYFLQKHAQRADKPIKTIPPEVMQALVRWHWPGNVRELENMIERAVILSKGPELRVSLSELKSDDEVQPAPGSSPRLESVEREHILQVLRETKGVIGGPQGAATKLGLKRTTLNFKMRKLGITRQDI